MSMTLRQFDTCVPPPDHQRRVIISAYFTAAARFSATQRFTLLRELAGYCKITLHFVLSAQLKKIYV